MSQPECTHLDHIHDVTPGSEGCLECGHVGCCDSSLHKHATKHFRATHHPVMMSAEPGENWKYCYVDEVMWE